MVRARQGGPNGDGIDEHFVFDGLDEKPISVFYPALGSRANRLTEWAAFDAAGLLLMAGSTAANNNAYTYLPAGTKRLAQFDPVLQNGLVTTGGRPKNLPNPHTRFLTYFDRGG